MPRPVALVTGPTSGLGLSFARLLAERGYDLVLVSRDQQRLDQLATELRQGGRVDVEAFTADLTTRDGMALVEARLAGGVDLLVNNAGFGLKGGLLDNSVDDEQRMLDILVTAVLRLTHAALGPMVERGSGSVINVSSFVALMGAATSQIAYTASKGAVLSLSRELAVQFARQGVRVNALCPGPVETPLLMRLFSDDPAAYERRRVHLPMGRLATAREIANAALFLASDDSSYVNGATFLVDGGLSAAYVTPE